MMCVWRSRNIRCDVTIATLAASDQPHYGAASPCLVQRGSNEYQLGETFRLVPENLAVALYVSSVFQMTVPPEPVWIDRSVRISDEGQWDSWNRSARGRAATGPCTREAQARGHCTRNVSSARRYLSATSLVARNVLIHSAVGGVLKSSIDQTRHAIRVRPQEGTDEHRRRGSASAGLTIDTPRELARATPAGETVLTPAGRPTRPPLTGTGGGALMATVNFSPLHYGPEGWDSARCTLLHEIFHAYQIVAGQKLTSPVLHYPNLEEWESVMVQNMLCSEYGFALRDGYDFFDPVFQHLVDAVGGAPVRAAPARPTRPGELRERTGLTGSGLTPAVGVLRRAAGNRRIPQQTMQDFSRYFARHYQLQLEQFASGNGEFCRQLRGLGPTRVPFNPVRDMP